MSVGAIAIGKLFDVDSKKLELSDSLRARYRALAALFRREGERTGISPYLLAGVAWGESEFLPTAKNTSSGAAGVMQIMPAHFSSLGWYGTDWSNADKNITAGAGILADQLRSRGTTEKALAGYGGFTTWIRDPASVTPGSSKDARWYINNALARAFRLELLEALRQL